MGTLICITEETALPEGGFKTRLTFDQKTDYAITIQNPFSPEEEETLSWYFKDFLVYGGTADDPRLTEAGQSIHRCGESLFQQIFADPAALAAYQNAKKNGLDTLAFEIIGSPEFHTLHWEALRDPQNDQPLSIHAPFVRRSLQAAEETMTLKESPTINILLISARPNGASDIDYHVVSRLLARSLRQSGLRIHLDMVYPGTYEGLVKHLERKTAQHGPGYYHILHIDAHGSLLTHDEMIQMAEQSSVMLSARYGRAKLETYENLKAYIFFETPQVGTADPVEASELAQLLQLHQIPIVLLDSCESGRQIGANNTSLGSHLMEAGVKLALGMSYTVSVQAAAILTGTLYRELFSGSDPHIALTKARREIHHNKLRFNSTSEQIEMEDWILPVLYQHQPIRLQTREFTPEELAAYYTAQAEQFAFPEPAYSFYGRDDEMWEIEKLMLDSKGQPQGKPLLISGPLGAGKTTLIKHLAAWWHSTGLIEKVWYFNFGEQEWTRAMLMEALTQNLSEGDRKAVGLMPPAAQQAFLADKMRARRYLIVFDNLEMIPEDNIPATGLKELLRSLQGGQTMFLLGSRSQVPWLTGDVLVNRTYNVRGLDESAAGQMIYNILAQYNALARAGEPGFAALINLLHGNPQLIEAIIPQLAHKQPIELLHSGYMLNLEGLEKGDSGKISEIKEIFEVTASVLDPELQKLQICLMPFIDGYLASKTERYQELLKAQPGCAGLAVDRLPELLWLYNEQGILTPHSLPGVQYLHPFLNPFLRPLFLQEGLAGSPEADNALRQGINLAFLALHQEIGAEVTTLMESEDAEERQNGLEIANLLVFNLSTALDVALANDPTTIYQPYQAVILREHLQPQFWGNGVNLCNYVLNWFAALPAEKVTPPLRVEKLIVLGDLGKFYYNLEQYPEALAAYQLSRDDLLQFNDPPDYFNKDVALAGVYYQIGYTARTLEDWAVAKENTESALQLYEKCEDLSLQAQCHTLLAAVASGEDDQPASEAHYLKAIELYRQSGTEFNEAQLTYLMALSIDLQQQYDRAIEVYKKAVELFTQAEDLSGQADCYYQMGLDEEYQDRWEEASGYYKQAFDLYSEAENYPPMGQAIYHIGLISIQVELWEEAENCFVAAVNMAVATNDLDLLADSSYQLAELKYDQEKYDEAETFYKQALEAWTVQEDEYNQAECYYGLGWIAYARDQYPEATELELQALTLHNEFEDNQESIDQVMEILGYIWKESKDKELPGRIGEILGLDAKEVKKLLKPS